MFPRPILNFFPRLFQGDAKAAALASFMDVELAAIKADVLGIARNYRFDEVDAILLPEIAFLLDVQLYNQDSERTKRLKIKNALLTHRYRGTWGFSVKPQLDAITGYDAQILLPAFRAGEWVLIGDGGTLTDATVASLGSDGVGSGLGFDLSGGGDEVNVKGNVYINLHDGVMTAVLTAAQVAAIATAVTTDIIPAYYKIFLGYVNAGGVFVPYLSF